MQSIKKVFNYISYLQYPTSVAMLYFAYKPILFGSENIWSDLNTTLVLTGLAVSFSSLQDTTKMQNKLSKRVYENPKYAKIFLIYLGILTLVVLGFGIYGYFFSTNENIKEIALGSMMLAIGLMGLLKMAIEMAEYHGKKE